MRMRVLVVATLLIAAMVAADRSACPVACPCAAAKAAASAPVPRTPWGHPDLQGTWDYKTITPLERPAQYGDLQDLTDVEVKTLEERAGKRMDEPPSDEQPNQAGRSNATYLTDPGRRVGRRPAHVAHHRSARRSRPGARQRRCRAWRLTRRWIVAAAPRVLVAAPIPGPIDRCSSAALPGAFPPPACLACITTTFRSCRSPDSVVIVHEMVHDARVIPLDSRPRVTGKGNTTRNYLGESRDGSKATHWSSRPRTSARKRTTAART